MTNRFEGRRDQIERAERLAEKMMERKQPKTKRAYFGYADTERTRLYEQQIVKFRAWEIDYIEHHLMNKELAAMERLMDIVAEAKNYKKPRSLSTWTSAEFTDRQLEIAIASLEKQANK